MNDLIILMNERKQLFSEFVKQSTKISCSEIDELDELINTRDAIRLQIEIIDQKIKKIYENRSDVDIISRVIKNKIDSRDVTDEYQVLYAVAQATFTIIFQAIKVEEIIKKRLEEMQIAIIENIKASSNVSKITRYLNALDDQDIPEGSLLDKGARSA